MIINYNFTTVLVELVRKQNYNTQNISLQGILTQMSNILLKIFTQRRITRS